MKYFGLYPELNRDHRPFNQGKYPLISPSGCVPQPSQPGEKVTLSSSICTLGQVKVELKGSGNRKQEDADIPAPVGSLRNITNKLAERRCDGILVPQKQHTSVKASCRGGMLAGSSRANGACPQGGDQADAVRAANPF